MTAQRYRGRRFIDLAYSPVEEGYIMFIYDGAISIVPIMLSVTDPMNGQVQHWGLNYGTTGNSALEQGDMSTDGTQEFVGGGNASNLQSPTCYVYPQSTIAEWTKRWLRSTTAFGASGTPSPTYGFRFDPNDNNYGIFLQLNGPHLFTKTVAGVPGAWTYLGRAGIFDTYDTTFVANAPNNMCWSPNGAYFVHGSTGNAAPRVRLYRRASATSYVLATVTGSGGTQNHLALGFTSATKLAAGLNASPYIMFYENTGVDTWAYTKGIDTDNPTLVGGDLNNAVNTLVVNAAGTAMFAAVNTITAPGLGHCYFTGSGDTWTYYGQLPSAPITVVQRAQFTPDGNYLFVGFTGNGIHVWDTSAPASPSYLGPLTYAAGLQNGGKLTSTDASPDKWFIGNTTRPYEEGRTAIDTAISALNPTHWWKCSEFGDQNVDELRVMLPNYGSERGGPTFGNTAVTATNITTRVAGPIAGSYAITSQASAPGLTTVSGNDGNPMDAHASGTFAFFIKTASTVALFRPLFVMGAAASGVSVTVGVYNGVPAIRLNNSGGVASGRQLYYADTNIADDTWHLVVIRQPANGSGPAISIDGVAAGMLQNPGGTWTNTTNDDMWFSAITSAVHQILGDSLNLINTEVTCCHFFHMSTQMSAGEEAGLVTAAGL